MNRILAEIIGLVLALSIGFGIGWHAKGVSAAAGQLKTSQAETQAVITGVTKQAKDKQATAVVEQGKTLALGIDQNHVRSSAELIQAEIDRAQFNIPPPVISLGPTTIENACPDDPVGSDEFVRLYDAAAKGADPATAASTSTR